MSWRTKCLGTKKTNNLVHFSGRQAWPLGDVRKGSGEIPDFLCLKEKSVLLRVLCRGVDHGRRHIRAVFPTQSYQDAPWRTPHGQSAKSRLAPLCFGQWKSSTPSGRFLGAPLGTLLVPPGLYSRRFVTRWFPQSLVKPSYVTFGKSHLAPADHYSLTPSSSTPSGCSRAPDASIRTKEPETISDSLCNDMMSVASKGGGGGQMQKNSVPSWPNGKNFESFAEAKYSRTFQKVVHEIV